MPVLLSIITVTLNNAKGLNNTLNSIAAQTCREFEWIIIDGESTDGTLGILESNRNLINNYVSEKDGGIYDAMNKGWQLSTGHYCLFLNAGDELAGPDVIEKVLPYLQNQNGDFYYGNIIGDNSDGKEQSTYFDEPVSLHYLLRWYLPHPASFIKKSLLQTLSGYSTRYRIISDWIFTVNVFLAGYSFSHVPIVVSRFYSDGISSINMQLHSEEKERIYKEEFCFLLNDYRFVLASRKLSMSRPIRILNQLLSLFRK
jgi:glycosyltransferase involved in cell wall biosynthesis